MVVFHGADLVWMLDWKSDAFAPKHSFLFFLKSKKMIMYPSNKKICKKTVEAYQPPCLEK